jgi:hypothetical protein
LRSGGRACSRKPSGRTRGYRNHPQLNRFREVDDPASVVTEYLRHVAKEARQRGYSFDEEKLRGRRRRVHLTVSSAQLAYEWEHLRAKLRSRDPVWYDRFQDCVPTPHPLFNVVDGPVAEWERRKA